MEIFVYKIDVVSWVDFLVIFVVLNFVCEYVLYVLGLLYDGLSVY